MIKDLKKGNYRIGEKSLLDRYFANRLNELAAKAYDAYDKTEYRQALKFSLFEYQV